MLLTPTVALAQEQRAVLEVIVNEVATGESLVILRDGDALIPVAALARAGVRGIAGAREEVGDELLVSLRSLAPAVAFRIDEVTLRLLVTADPSLLEPYTRDLFPGAPENLVYRADTSGFLNYSLSYASGGDVDGFAESAVSVGGASIHSTLSATRHSVTRGLTTVTIDQRTHLRRWSVGDSFAFAGPLGGDSWIGGISVAKEFSINPYFVRHPTLSVSTPIVVPSIMEVQVNGRLVSREAVAPGRLELRNLPMTLGRNDAHVIVRDAFGVEREISSTYYLTTTALAKGLHEYQYSVGFQRQGVGSQSWNYRAPVALARHRAGISDMVTAGGRIEAQRGLFSAGPSLNLRLPVGEMEVAAGVSRRGRDWGTASLVGFNVTGRRLSAGGSAFIASRHYRTLAPNALGEDPAVQASGFTSASVGSRISLTLQQTMTRLHQGITRSRSGLLATIHLARRLDVTASLSRSRDERGHAREVYGGVTVLLGRASASVSHVRDTRGRRMALDAQQSLPVGEGYGYQLHAESGANGATTGVARYQGRRGRYEVRQESIAGRAGTTLTAMGSLVAVGGGLYASRPVQDSFALIRVPGIEGVRAYASHQAVGKTSRTGDLLVPDLQAYYGNILDVADSDIPLTHSIGAVGQTLALPYRGGAVALFPAYRTQRVVGTVRIVEGAQERAPAYGEITVSVGGRIIVSPVGSRGAFYFEDLPAGNYVATVREVDGQTCTFALSVPSSEEPAVNLGLLGCEVRRP